MSDPDSDSDDPLDRQHAPRQVHCRTCGITYRSTHYHCCLCRRVFRSASAYERHQGATERPDSPASDAQLRRLGLVINGAGVWMKQGTHSAPSSADVKAHAAKAPTGGDSDRASANTSSGAGAPISPAKTRSRRVPAPDRTSPTRKRGAA